MEIPKIKALRAEKGLTQKALADAAGVNIRQIQKIEACEIRLENVTLGNALRLAEALDVSVEELLPG